MGGVDISLAGGWIEVACNVHPPGEVVVSMRPASVFAKSPGSEIEQLRAVAQIVARLIGLPPRAVVLAEDETHLNLLPHVRASWTPRGARPQVLTPGTTARSQCSARWR